MHVPSILLLIALLGAPATLAGQASNENLARCNAEGIDLDLKIAGCTAVIQSGQLNDTNLSIAFNNRGIAYYNKKDYDRAIQDYDQAIRLNPSFADAFNNRGNAYYYKKDYDRAIQDYTEAIRLNPSFALAFNNRGNAYRDKQDDDRAIQDYDQAIRLNPSDAGMFYNRGNAYRDKQDYDRAIQDYDQAIRLNPSFADAFNNRGYTYFYLDKFAAAQSDFTTAFAASPADAYLVLWLYLSTARAGLSARAGLEANAAQVKLADWPGPVVQTYLGKMTTAQLLSAAANPDAQKDREQHCEAYFYLGEQALIAGRRTEAKRLFQQSIDTGVTSFVEYAGAQSELKRLQATPAAGSH